MKSLKAIGQLVRDTLHRFVQHPNRLSVFHFTAMQQRADGTFNLADGMVRTDWDVSDENEWLKLRDEIGAKMNPPTMGARIVILSFTPIQLNPSRQTSAARKEP